MRICEASSSEHVTCVYDWSLTIQGLLFHEALG